MSEKNGGFVAFVPIRDHEYSEPTQFFILGEDKQPVPVTEAEWLSWALAGAGDLAEDIVDDIEVTTTFIGFNVGDDEANPQMFETVVYGQRGGQVLDMRKLTTTYDKAMVNHALGLGIVRGVMSKGANNE